MYNSSINLLLDKFQSISLEEMRAISLMNRIDTKYLTTQKRLLDLLTELLPHYYVQENNGRRVNLYKTLYYDTIDDFMYLSHHNRRRPREKIRVREYVESDLSFFEVKNKSNRGRTLKQRSQLTDDINHSDAFIDDFLHQNAQFQLKDLLPKIQNKFNRITLVNKNKTERLTVDFDISFKNLTTNSKSSLDNLVVIELKQSKNIASQGKEILKSLRILSMSFSKFCIGSSLTNPKLKNNLFKQQLRAINKLITS